MGRNVDFVCSTLFPSHDIPLIAAIRRSGAPHWQSVTSSPTPPSWANSVSWEKGDILAPSTYTQHLDNADAVIHSMGILLEADYKGVISGRESPIAGLQRAFSASKQGTQNPLEQKEGEPLRPQEKDGQLTYEVMNRDSGTASNIIVLSRPS